MTNYFETSAKIVLNFPCRIRQGAKIIVDEKLFFTLTILRFLFLPTLYNHRVKSFYFTTL